MIYQPRLSDSGKALYAKASTHQLSRREQEELHLEFLGIMYSVRQRMSNLMHVKSPFKLTLGFPRFLDFKQRYEFSVTMEIDHTVLVRFEILFDALGESLLVADMSGLHYSEHFQERLSTFLNSPAYKRYFKHHSQTTYSHGVFQTVIPKSQIRSKHLFDYVIHLIDQTRDIVEECTKITSLAQAA